jgi:hypothetical protein
MSAFGWGILLWLFGYMLGMVLFALVPINLIGWIITPFATVLTIWVALKKARATSFAEYAGIALIWFLIAVLGDYLFIVKLLNPPDGYYKFDVYLYYVLTLAIPLVVGIKATQTHP